MGARPAASWLRQWCALAVLVQNFDAVSIKRTSATDRQRGEGRSKMAYSTYGALVDLQAQAKTSRRAAKSWPVFRRHCSARNHNRAAVKLDKMTTTK